jgi:hypothetical protein
MCLFLPELEKAWGKGKVTVVYNGLDQTFMWVVVDPMLMEKKLVHLCLSLRYHPVCSVRVCVCVCVCVCCNGIHELFPRVRC